MNPEGVTGARDGRRGVTWSASNRGEAGGIGILVSIKIRPRWV